MSLEQSMVTNFDQPANDGTVFRGDENIGLHESSTMLSYNELKAREIRAEIESLNNGVSPVAAEALKSHIEISRMAPQSQIRKFGQKLRSMREGDVKFDLENDDELDPNMFNTPTQDMFDKAA